MSYYVALTFHPNQANPARPSGRGVYRVHHAGAVSEYAKGFMRPRARPILLDEGSEPVQVLYLPAKRLYKDRSRVDPRKVLGV